MKLSTRVEDIAPQVPSLRGMRGAISSTSVDNFIIIQPKLG